MGQSLGVRGTPAIYLENGQDTRHTVYVFTDITCGYCQRFHRDVAELNSNGVAVRYLAFPRAGIDAESFKDMESGLVCRADLKFGHNPG